MQLRKLYRTVEAIAAQQYEKEEDFFTHVLDEIVRNEEIELKGGRLWKLDSKTGSYVLVTQVGDIDPIKKNYRIKVRDVPLFFDLPKLRTVLAHEEDQYLRKRGILKYSATGIGEKINYRGKLLFKYVLAFNADRLDENVTSTLNIISTALTSVLRSRKIERKAAMLERDIDKAREIQQSILPQHELRFHKYEIYGVSIPSRIVGGDFFDYLQIDGDTERVGVVIGDAASKGFSAAAEALYVSGALRMGFEHQTKISALLTRINRLLHKTFSEEHFVTLFYAELTDDKNGLVVYSNCGHNNPYLLRAGSGTPEAIETTGQILGPFPEESFRTESLLMKSGDILLLYTDGLVDARSIEGEFYGEARLMESLVRHRDLSAKEITQSVLQDIVSFSATEDVGDDKTIVTIKRIG
jgi:phosphoserine phosphatase RsbU/P